jgi:hypothetical protein
MREAITRAAYAKRFVWLCKALLFESARELLHRVISMRLRSTCFRFLNRDGDLRCAIMLVVRILIDIRFRLSVPTSMTGSIPDTQR